MWRSDEDEDEDEDEGEDEGEDEEHCSADALHVLSLCDSCALDLGFDHLSEAAFCLRARLAACCSRSASSRE